MNVSHALHEGLVFHVERLDVLWEGIMVLTLALLKFIGRVLLLCSERAFSSDLLHFLLHLHHLLVRDLLETPLKILIQFILEFVMQLGWIMQDVVIEHLVVIQPEQQHRPSRDVALIARRIQPVLDLLCDFRIHVFSSVYY